MKKIFALLLALAMVLALGTAAFAEGGTTPTAGKITISNAAVGETYTLYKIFAGEASTVDPTVMLYKAPEGFTGNDYFGVNADKYVYAKDAAKAEDGTLTQAAIASLKAYAVDANKIDEIVASASTPVEFSGLDYGYYLIKTTHGVVGETDSLVTITSNVSDIVVKDKNSSIPEWHEEPPEDPDDPPTNPPKGKTILKDGKNVEAADFNIGDEVTFQIKIDTANVAGDDNKQIVSYLIGDTFPSTLQFLGIQSVKVNDTVLENEKNYYATSATVEESTVQAFPIKVTWATKAEGADTYTSLYSNYDVLTVTYKAKVLDNAVIDGNGNINTATFNYKTADTETTPTVPEDPDDGDNPTSWTDTATVYTYAIALKKISAEKGTALAGATFKLPFNVKTDEKGNYIYAGTGEIKEGSGLVNEVTTPDSGELLILGVAAGEYEIEETVAPSGYNLIQGKWTVTAVKTGETTTSVTKYLDAEGNIVDTKEDSKTYTDITYSNNSYAASVAIIPNFSGTILPSTGGAGTTLFIAIGAVAFLATALVLVTKKRMYNQGA